MTDPQKQIFEELKQKLNDYIETSIKDTENKFKDDIENIKVSKTFKSNYKLCFAVQGNMKDCNDYRDFLKWLESTLCYQKEII